MKAMQKSQIAETHQERNVQAEKDLLLECAHPFVLALVATYQDEHRLYMLMEIIQGGELWSLIYEKVDATRSLRAGGCGAFEQSSAKFFAGCVIEAFAHIHGKSVAYRDLKPENLLLDERGYVKVIDFGFAKRVPLRRGRPATVGTDLDLLGVRPPRSDLGAGYKTTAMASP